MKSSTVQCMWCSAVDNGGEATDVRYKQGAVGMRRARGDEGRCQMPKGVLRRRGAFPAHLARGWRMHGQWLRGLPAWNAGWPQGPAPRCASSLVVRWVPECQW